MSEWVYNSLAKQWEKDGKIVTETMLADYHLTGNTSALPDDFVEWFRELTGCYHLRGYPTTNTSGTAAWRCADCGAVISMKDAPANKQIVSPPWQIK